jgi:integrase
MPVISDLGVSLWESYMPDSTKSQQPKLLDQVRQVLRLHHYSIHTERSYVDWIVRFVRFHSMRSREDLLPAEATVQELLEHANVDTTMIYTHVLNRPGISSIPR